MKKITFILLFVAVQLSAQLIDTNNSIWKDEKSAVKDSMKIKNMLDLAREYKQINIDSSLIFAQNALAYSIEEKFGRGRVESLYQIGLCNFYLSNMKEAINYYNRSLKVAEIIGYKKFIAQNYKMIGGVYSHEKKYRKGLDYNFKALEILIDMKDSINYARTVDNIGSYYRKLNKYDSAFYYINKALEINLEKSYFKSTGYNYNNLANIYLNLTKYDLALKYYQKSLKIKKEYGKKSDFIHAYNNIGNVLTFQKKYKEAIPYFEKSIAIATELKIVNNLSLFYGNLAKAQKGLNNYKYALKYKILQKQLSDSLNNVETKIFIARKEAELLIKEKEKEKRRLEKIIEIQHGKQQQRNILIIILIIAICIVTFLIFNTNKKTNLLKILNKKESDLHATKSKQKILKEKEKAAKKINTANKFLTQRISQLLKEQIGMELKKIQKSISGSIKDKNCPKKEIKEELSKLIFAERFANTLAFNLTPLVLENQNLISAIENYIENIFEKSSTKVSLLCKNPLSLNLLSNDLNLNIFRIIQELSINVLQHAKAKHLNIEISDTKNTIEIIAEDNGKGFDQQQQQQQGIGLFNIKQRVKLYGGKLKINTEIGKGTKIFIKMNYNKKIKK